MYSHDGLKTNDEESDEGFKASRTLVKDGWKWKARKREQRLITGE